VGELAISALSSRLNTQLFLGASFCRIYRIVSTMLSKPQASKLWSTTSLSRSPSRVNSSSPVYIPSLAKHTYILPPGAKFYYMRGILHDFPDDKCRVILQHCIDVLAPDSLILIDDMVLPNTGVYWQTAQVDLTMMVALAARERTHEQWTALLDSVGLRIVDIHVYTPPVHESVITCVPK